MLLLNHFGLGQIDTELPLMTELSQCVKLPLQPCCCCRPLRQHLLPLLQASSSSGLSDHSQQLPQPSQSASPLSMNDFLVLFNQQKDMLQQMLTQILELKETKSQVTDVDGLRLDLRKLCAELQQTHKVEMGLEVERQVSVRVAPLQQELDAVKLELQQLRGKVESSPTSTSQQQPQPDVSNLESKVQRIEQATMQQADQTDRAARQLRAKNAVLRNFRQAENETPDTLKQAVSQFVSNRMQTDAVVAKATRFSNKREGDASPGLVIVEFGSVADKKKVFRARGKLAGCEVGLDDDLTPLQQKQKAAAWDKFKEARAGNLKTRWEAEKLYIKQGEEWVAHSVCAY